MNKCENMKYGIIGTGAIGGFYGGKLAKSGKEVHFLFHRDYEYVREHYCPRKSVNILAKRHILNSLTIV